jgi:hypothetical protein
LHVRHLALAVLLLLLLGQVCLIFGLSLFFGEVASALDLGELSLVLFDCSASALEALQLADAPGSFFRLRVQSVGRVYV